MTKSLNPKESPLKACFLVYPRSVRAHLALGAGVRRSGPGRRAFTSGEWPVDQSPSGNFPEADSRLKATAEIYPADGREICESRTVLRNPSEGNDSPK